MSKIDKVIYAFGVFVPLAGIAYFLNFNPVVIFVFSGLSFFALSHMLSQATEHVAYRSGDFIGGFLNVTFGNFAEFIIAFLALREGLTTIVKTALIGSIAGQTLLVLGSSLLVAGLKYRKLKFNRDMVQMNYGMLIIVALIMGALTVFHTKTENTFHLSIGASILLLMTYGAVMLYSFRHKKELTPEEGEKPSVIWTLKNSVFLMIASTLVICFMSHTLVESIEPLLESTGLSENLLGIIIIPIFSNVVNHVVAITTAAKNKMNLSLSISLGSASQIAGFVFPLLVIMSIFVGVPLEFNFSLIELTSMGIGVAVLHYVILDGESQWVEGCKLVLLYAFLAVLCYFVH